MKKTHWAIIPTNITDTSKPISESILSSFDVIPLRVTKSVDKKTNVIEAGGISSQKTTTTLLIQGALYVNMIKKASESSMYNNVLEYFYEPKDVSDKHTGKKQTKLEFSYNLYKILSTQSSSKKVLLTLIKSNKNENNSEVQSFTPF